MKTVSELSTLAYNMRACKPALLYLANLEPSAPVELAFDKLKCDDREWLVWLIDRSLFHGHAASIEMRAELVAVKKQIANFEIEWTVLYQRMRAPFNDRLNASTTSESFWAIYDNEFRPEFNRHAYALWSAEFVPQMRPTIVKWLHALEVHS